MSNKIEGLQPRNGSSSGLKIVIALLSVGIIALLAFVGNSMLQGKISEPKQVDKRETTSEPIPKEFIPPVIIKKAEPKPEPVVVIKQVEEVELEPIPVPSASIINEVIIEVPSIADAGDTSMHLELNEKANAEIEALKFELTELKQEQQNQLDKERAVRNEERRQARLAEIEAEKEAKLAEIEAIEQRKLSSDLVGQEVKSINASKNPASQSEKNSLLASRLETTSFKASSASKIDNLSMKILKGTMIPCTLQTRIISSLPGFVSCVVSEGIQSADGKVTLVDKGTKIFGEYQSGLAKGDIRLFVTWTELVTPEGVRIPLGSPATGALGSAGLGGYVDRRYLERFMGAILVSMVDDAVANNQESIAGGASSSATNAGADQAQELIEELVDLPAVLYKAHGERALVFVARDLDFSGIYDLQ